MAAFRVLHLSDIHIGKTYTKSEDIAYKIVSDIAHNRLCGIRNVIVTGDIFDGQVDANEELVNECVQFFTIILEQLNQEGCILTKNDFIFIPGNHDLIRVDNEEKKWSKYKSFLTNFYGDIPEFYNKKNYSLIKEYEDQKIVFIGFNSCQIEKKKIFDKKYVDTLDKNIGFDSLKNKGINKDKLIELLRSEEKEEYDDYGEVLSSQIAEINRAVKKLDGYNIVALLHHHFFLFPEVAQQFGDSSLVRNYANFVKQLKYMNVKTVLHGHKHFDLERPYITDDYYEATGTIIDVFSGGSVGSIRKDKHTFSIIDFFQEKDDIKLIQNKFVYNEEALDPIIRKQIPPKNTADRVIKLIEHLKFVDYDAYTKYAEASGKLNKIYKTCDEIINWTSEALMGFREIYKYLDFDYRNIAFLLYAINYRTLSYKTNIENDNQYFASGSTILNDLFYNCLISSNFDIDPDEFNLLFSVKRLKELADECDKLLNKSKNKSTQQYLAFSMVGIFFADLYLVLTEYADDFYKENVKYKVNIKIEENKFHQNVPAPSIAISSDADRRSIYVQMRCNEATAHKIAVLFIKEFDLIINKFEEYFKLIGLKLYYLFPKIDKDCLKDTLDNYNFEAYIPTLLPLLTGDNIYPSKEVFSRELIQNSIDAIAVREAKEQSHFEKTIYIEFGKDKNSRVFFEIRDNGTGMDRYKIERYFTSIGRSFYSGDEYEDLNISYKPISNFGIGFLSSFMVCHEIDVKTKYFLPNSEGLKLHIPNYDGCFFIELDGNINVGTEIKLYIDKELDIQKIVNYIKKVIVDIKYNVIIKNDKDEHLISAHDIRKNNKHKDCIFFVPFFEDGNIQDVEWEKEVLSGEYISKYEYGMLIRPNMKNQNNDELVLNAGILVEQTSLDILIDKNNRDHFLRTDEKYSDIIANFPANWIQIDVSREKLTGFSDMIKNLGDKDPEQKIGNRIANAMYKQITSFLNYAERANVNIPVIYVDEIIRKLNCFCVSNSSIHQKFGELKYFTEILLDQDGITYVLKHRGNSKEKARTYRDLVKQISEEEWSEKLHSKKYCGKSSLDIMEYYFREIFRLAEPHVYASNRVYYHKDLSVQWQSKFLKSKEKEFGLDLNQDEIFYIFSIRLMFINRMDGNDEARAARAARAARGIIPLLESLMLQQFSVSAVERGDNKVRIQYADLFGFVDKLGDFFEHGLIAERQLELKKKSVKG